MWSGLGMERIPGIYAPLSLGAGGGCMGVSGELGVQAVHRWAIMGSGRDITGPCLEYLGHLKKPVLSDAASAANNRIRGSPSLHRGTSPPSRVWILVPDSATC